MVKTILKRNNVLLSQFATDINISRPTLNSYIDSYDNDGTISNTLYQKIFDFLFSDPLISPEEFKQKYKYVLDNYGHQADLVSASSTISSLNTLNDPEETDDEETTMLKELYKDNDKALLCYLKYNMIKNGKFKIDDIKTEEIIYIITFFQLEQRELLADYSYDEKKWNICKNKLTSNSTIELKQQIINKLSDAVEKAVSNGDTASLESIIKALNLKGGNN